MFQLQFPEITPGLGRYEEAPMNSVHIPARARNKLAARKFLAFVARPDVQESINYALLQIPVNHEAKVADDRFLAAGITQAVIAQLMHFPDLRLFSTPASLAEAADPRDPGRGPGSTYVVQGTIRSEDDLVHVRVMLTDAATGEGDGG